MRRRRDPHRRDERPHQRQACGAAPGSADRARLRRERSRRALAAAAQPNRAAADHRRLQLDARRAHVGGQRVPLHRGPRARDVLHRAPRPPLPRLPDRRARDPGRPLDRDRVLRRRHLSPDARVRLRRRRPLEQRLRRPLPGQRARDLAAPDTRDRNRDRVRDQRRRSGAARPRPARAPVAERVAGASARARTGLRHRRAPDRDRVPAERGRDRLRGSVGRAQLGRPRRGAARPALVPLRAAALALRRDDPSARRRAVGEAHARGGPGRAPPTRSATRPSSSATSRPTCPGTSTSPAGRSSSRRRTANASPPASARSSWSCTTRPSRISPSSTRCSTPRGSRSSAGCRFARSPPASAGRARCSRRCPDSMYRVAADGTFLEFRLGETARLPVDSDDLVGMNVREILSPEASDAVFAAMRARARERHRRARQLHAAVGRRPAATPRGAHRPERRRRGGRDRPRHHPAEASGAGARGTRGGTRGAQPRGGRRREGRAPRGGLRRRDRGGRAAARRRRRESRPLRRSRGGARA